MRRLIPTLTAVILAPTLAHADGPVAATRVAELAAPVLMALTVLAVGAGATASLLVAYLVLPGVSRRSALLVRRTPARSLIYGLLVPLVILLALLLARSIEPVLAKLLVLVLGLPCAVLGLIGGAAVCYSLGESLLTAAGSPHHDSGPWAVGAGAVLLSLANLLPGLGQVLCLVALLTGLGAAVRQLLNRQPASATPSPPPTAG